MMGTAEKYAVSEETSVNADECGISLNYTECIKEAFIIERNSYTEDLTSRATSAYATDKDRCESTLVIDKQRNSIEKIEETNAANENSNTGEGAQDSCDASSKRAWSNAEEAVDKNKEGDKPDFLSYNKEMGCEVEAAGNNTELDHLDAASSTKELCAMDEAQEQRRDLNDSIVASYKKEMFSLDKSVEGNTKIKVPNVASSGKEMCDAEEGIEADNSNNALSIEEMHNIDEAAEDRIEIDKSNIASSSQENTVNETYEERTEVDDNSNVTSSSRKLCAMDEAVEKTNESDNASSCQEVCAVNEAAEEKTEVDKPNIASFSQELCAEERAEVYNNSSVASSSGEVCTMDEAAEERAEADNPDTASSSREVCAMDEAAEGKTKVDPHPNMVSSRQEVCAVDAATEKSTEADNLDNALSNQEMFFRDEATGGKAELDKTNIVSSSQEVCSVKEVAEGRTEDNTNDASSNQEVCAADEATEEMTETDNSNNVSSNQEVCAVDEAAKEMTEDNPNVAVSKRGMLAVGEVVEKKTEADNLNAASSSKQNCALNESVEEKTKAKNLRAVPSRREKRTIDEVVEGITEAHNSSIAPPKRKFRTADKIYPCICGPSRQVHPVAGTSTSSSSRNYTEISILGTLPSKSNRLRGCLSLYNRRALLNRQRRLAEGFRHVFNGKNTAPKRPQMSAPRVHVTAEAFPSLASALYSMLPETFKEAVSLSMMEYYFMILYYHRLAGLRMNRRNVPFLQDDILCSNLELGPLFVPEVFEQWISMRGHDINTGGEAIRLILPALPRETGDFGRVSAATHWRYISDLAPRIFRDRIAADLEHTLSSGPVEWDLSEDIRPLEKNCGLPTRNLIGYHVAQKLTNRQLDILHICGLGLWKGKAVFPINIKAECYHLNIHLVEAVSQHFAVLRQHFCIVRHARFVSQPSSAGLITYAERLLLEREEYLFDRNVSHYEQTAKVRAYAPTLMNNELAKGAVVLLPRVYRRKGNRPIDHSWCAYDFGFYFMVPDDWVATRNNAYKQGSWQSWHTPYLKTGTVIRISLLKSVLRRLLFSRRQMP